MPAFDADSHPSLLIAGAYREGGTAVGLADCETSKSLPFGLNMWMRINSDTQKTVSHALITNI
jgi:hypothetical protein